MENGREGRELIEQALEGMEVARRPIKTPRRLERFSLPPPSPGVKKPKRISWAVWKTVFVMKPPGQE